MIGDRFLPSPEGPTLLLTASDDRHDDDIQTAGTGDAYGAHDYRDDLPSPRRRDRLVIMIAVIALAGLGAVGAFAYRAVFALPPIIKAENAPNENVPNYDDDRPSDLSLTQRQGHPKHSRLPQRRVRSVGLYRSLLTPMAIRLRCRRLAPVCLRVREPLRKLPPA